MTELHVSVTPYPADGDAGVRQTLIEMAKLIRDAEANVSFQQFAEMVVRQKVPVKERLSNRRAAQILLDYVRDNVRYRPDPESVEMVKAAPITLCVPGAAMCIPVEDCDGLTVAFGSLTLAYGIPTRILKQAFADTPEEEHVLVAFQDDDGTWLAADPSSTTLPIGQRVQADNEVWVDPTDAASLGLPPDAGRFVVVSGMRDIALVGGEQWVERRGGRLWLESGGQWLDRGPVVSHVRLGRLLQVERVAAQLGDATPTTPVMPAPSGPGRGITTPGDVMAYKQTWDPYIKAMSQAMATCGAAWSAAAQGQSPSTPINTAQFATPPNATSMQEIGTAETQNADTLLNFEWAKYDSLQDYEIVYLAGDILQYYQRTVLKAGQWYAPMVQRDCPSLTLPTPPSLDVQAQVIGRIEGLGILEHGILQYLGIGATGVMVVVADTASGAANALKTAVTSTVPWAALAGVAGLVGGVFLAVKYGPGLAKMASRVPARQSNPRRTRWPDWMILESIDLGHGLTEPARDRAYELGDMGLIDMRSTWKLTRKGRETLQRERPYGEGRVA